MSGFFRDERELTFRRLLRILELIIWHLVLLQVLQVHMSTEKSVNRSLKISSLLTWLAPAAFIPQVQLLSYSFEVGSVAPKCFPKSVTQPPTGMQLKLTTFRRYKE